MRASTRKTLTIGLVAFAGLVVVAIAAAILVARSAWFRDQVRTRIVEGVENSTGGRAEIGVFLFDWRQLRAEIRDLTLHGTESSDAAPLLRINDTTAQLRASSLWKRRRLELQSLTLTQPQANVIVFPNGTTNIPGPRRPPDSYKTGLETVVDLEIGRFEIDNGSLQFADQKLPLSASGSNLAVQLVYELTGDLYRGQISISPLFVQSRANPRLGVDLNLPVVFRRDRIDLANAVISTPASRLQFSGTIDHLVSPNLSGNAAGQIDLAEMKRALGLKTPLSTSKSVPKAIGIDIGLNTPSEGARVSNARVVFGQSSLDAKGTLSNLAGLEGSFQFTSHLALSELARVFQLTFRSGGSVQLAGNVRLNGLSDYTVNADLTGRNLEYQDGDVRFSNLALDSRVLADPHAIQANPLRASWLGGHLDARASLQEFSRYRLDGTLGGLGLRQIAAQLGSAAHPPSKDIGYGGTISGTVEAEGNLKTAGTALEGARAKLTIIPNVGGIPVRGQLNATYNTTSQTLAVDQSFIALPSSRLDLNGTVGRQMVVHLVSRNLEDFRPLAPNMQLRFDAGGSAVADATIAGALQSPVVSGHVVVSRFAAEQRHFDQLAADIEVQSDHSTLHNGVLTRGALNAQFQASIGLDRWEPEPAQPLQAMLSMRNADVMDVLALAGEGKVPVQGSLTISAEASGTWGDPRGSADFVITNGSAYGQSIDRADGRIQFVGELATIPALQITSGMSRLNVNGTFQHPPSEFSSGTLRAHVDGSQVTLARVEPLHQRRPDLDGDVDLNMDAVAILEPPSAGNRIQLVSANGSFGARMLRISGENLGRVAASLQTSGNVVSYRIDSDLAGSTIRADGRTSLTPGYETTANLNVRNLPIEKALQVAGQRTIPARGMISANGQVGGTIQDPRANLDVNLTRATVQDQPIDQLQAHVDYSSTRVEVPSLSVQTGSSRVSAKGSFTHPAGIFSSGDVKLHVDSNALQLTAVRYLQQFRPDLSGSLQINLDGAAALNDSPTEPRVMLSTLNAKISGNGIRINGKDLGGFTATAAQAGSSVNVSLDSDLAQSKIHLNGQARLARNYPVDAHLTFENIRYVNLRTFLGTAAPSADFDALLEGSANVNGPVLSPANLIGSAQISKLELTPTQPVPVRSPAKGSATTLALHNDGPISVIASQGAIQVQRAHIVGPSTDLAVTGNVALHPTATFNLNVNGNTDLGIIQQIDKTASSSGTVALNAAVSGSLTDPSINGTLSLKNAAYQQLDWPVGISNANGEIVFTGTSARIQSLTAESGGGRITATGNVIRTGSGFSFNLQSRATRVLIRTDEGVSLTANANLRLSGTERQSVLGGDVNIVSLKFNPQTDVASVLTRAAAPMETPAVPGGLLGNMNLDIAVRIAPGVALQSAYAQGVQAQASLTLRGNALTPGMVGRINVTQGNLIFFGTKYAINQGSVSFFNPYKIEPILDLNLETTVQSVDVVLTVSGPVENMSLSYHSDPPLPFTEIVALLGAGRTPTSDPVLLANQPPVPQQSATDVGASALLGAAVANPVSGQLQRVFGVSQLKVAPTFVTGSTIPQAQVTLQQQVSQSVTFTYVTDLSQPDSQILRVEWAINPRWSAVASREINGLVGVDLFYKRRFQ